MNARVAISAAAAGLLALAQPALAQDVRGFDVEASVNVGHDTNVAKASKQSSLTNGINPSDTITTPRLTADILLPISRQSFYLRGTVGYQFYSKNDFYNANDSDITGGFNLHGGPCNGGLAQSYQRGRGAAQALSLVSERNVTTTETTTFNGACGREVGFAPTFNVAHSTGSNSLQQLASSDYETWTYALGLAYRRPGFGELSVNASETDTKDDLMVLIAGVPVKDGYKMTSYGVNYVRRFGARLEGDVHVAYTKVDPDLPIAPKNSGITYGAHIDFRPRDRITTRLAFDREAVPSHELGASYSVVTSEKLDGTYALGRQLTLTGGFSRAESLHRGITTLLPGVVTKETLSTVQAGARFGLGRRIFLTADTRWEKRNTDVVGLDYSGNLTSVGVAAKF